ncbi:hypothetical protein ACO0LD_23335 [Undibacterium sp. Ji83W]|uniref:hypothetical protein n=1 Tax=Undibacterium sp. Ji83W TaxID=3413043 RepID=UPI003BEFE5A4
MSGKVGHSNERMLACLAQGLIKFAASSMFATMRDFYTGFCHPVNFQHQDRSKIRLAARNRTGLIYTSLARSVAYMLSLMPGMAFLFLTGSSSNFDKSAVQSGSVKPVGVENWYKALTCERNANE